MDRLLRRRGAWWLPGVVLFVLALSGGCRNGLFTLAYLINGMDVDADYDGLKKKTVVVVCRPAAGIEYGTTKAAAGLAREISGLLQQRIPKIKVIDQEKVVQWCDNHSWEEYPEVGKALGAEMVVGVDLEHFSLQQGQTLYQGKAKVTVQVFDSAQGGKMVWEKHLPQSVYPPNTGIPTSEVQGPDFHREFLHVLAGQVARHFYAHDPHADLGQDSAALR
ncbi:MAG: hypothetical protein JXB10_06000 [Pirellulales bacterium]|nr:hypothetical protein [Pirellulales bacterium]